jgi:hypothetical protein
MDRARWSTGPCASPEAHVDRAELGYRLSAEGPARHAGAEETGRRQQYADVTRLDFLTISSSVPV